MLRTARHRGSRPRLAAARLDVQTRIPAAGRKADFDHLWNLWEQDNQPKRENGNLKIVLILKQRHRFGVDK